MTDRALLVHGASGHGKVVADAAMAAGWRVHGFSDDDPSKRGLRLLGFEVVAIGIEEVVAACNAHGLGVALGVGSNRARQSLFERLLERSTRVETVVHPSSVLSRSVRVGRGVVVFAGVVVNPDTELGDGVILNTGCTVDHDNSIGAFAHLSPGAHTGGTVVVGEGTHLGVGASVRNNIRVGSWSVVGAGASVVMDIPDSVVAVGVPARVVRRAEP